MTNDHGGVALVAWDVRRNGLGLNGPGNLRFGMFLRSAAKVCNERALGVSGAAEVRTEPSGTADYFFSAVGTDERIFRPSLHDGPTRPRPRESRRRWTQRSDVHLAFGVARDVLGAA